MKITIDTENKTLRIENLNQEKIIDLYSEEAFEIISNQWLKVGWDKK